MDEAIKSELERLHDEENRQNRRIELLEKNVESQHSLAISVEKLAVNMEHMVKEQKDQGERISRQGERLDKLEDAPAEQWKDVKKTALNTLVGALIGAAATGLIMLIAQYI